MHTFCYIHKLGLMLFTSFYLAYSHLAFANDLFVGKFSSEVKENFGTAKQGQVEVNIERKGERYLISVFNLGEFKFDYLAEPCSPQMEEKIGYLQEHPLGITYALCDVVRANETFFYSQNGIKDPLARVYKQQGIKNPQEAKYYRAQYYGHIQWGFYAFRKVDSFQFASNDAQILSTRETSEFINLCKTAGVKLLEKPSAPVRSLAYDWDPNILKRRPDVERIELDRDGRIVTIGGFGKLNSAEAQKRNHFEFTESRRDMYRAGAANKNPSAPYYHFPNSASNQPYYGVENLSADVLFEIEVNKPEELQKAPIRQGAIRYQFKLSDRRSGAILGMQTYVVDRLNNRACGANVDNNISQDAFIYDVINR